MEKADVTVIVPVYNGEETISRLFDSIISQTYSAWNVLVVDDGSEDKSSELIRSYIRKCPEKIKAITQENKGVAEARNRGIREADTEYVMFADQDDYMDSDYIEVYMNSIKKDDLDCVVGGFRRENESGKLIKKYEPINKWTVYSNLVPWARVFRRCTLIENDVSFLNNRIGEDIYFNFAFFSKTEKVSWIENEGYVWFYNENSVSNVVQKREDMLNDFINLLDRIVVFVDLSDGFFHAWLTKYVVWYLLYSCRDTSVDKFLENDRRLFAWLEEHGVKCKFPVRGVTDGETKKVKICISLYLTIRRWKLLKYFARMYCRG